MLSGYIVCALELVDRSW